MKPLIRMIAHFRNCPLKILGPALIGFLSERVIVLFVFLFCLGKLWTTIRDGHKYAVNKESVPIPPLCYKNRA